MLSSTVKKLERTFFYMVVMKSYLSDLQSTWSRSRSREPEPFLFLEAGAGAGSRSRKNRAAPKHCLELYMSHAMVSKDLILTFKWSFYIINDL